MRIYYKLIIVLLALSVIPLLFISCIGFYNVKNSLEKEILSKLEHVATEGVAKFETFLEERKFDMMILQHRDIFKAAFPVLEQFSNERSNPSYLEAKKAIDGWLEIFQSVYKYVDIMLTNKEGKIIYVYNPKHEFELNTFIADKDDVLQKTKTGVYVTDIHKTGGKENPFTLYMAAQAYDQADEFIGLVLSELDANRIFDHLYGDIELGDSGEIIWVKKTSDNKVLFLSPLKYEPAVMLKKTVTFDDKYALPMQKAVLGESGSGISLDYRAQDVLSVWRQIKSLGWGLVVKVDKKEAFLPIVKLRVLLAVVVSLIILLIVLTVLVVAKSISDPIHKLRKGIEIVGYGNLDYKVATNMQDEVGELSREFDKMTQSLKNSTISIENLNKEISERKKIEQQLIKNQDAFKNQTQELDIALLEALKSRKIFASMLADNNQIRKKLEDHVEELKVANSKIREAQAQIIQSSKMASIGQLAGGVAHEINNPLTGVLNNVQLIKELAREKKEFRLEDFEEILNIVEESAIRCKKIIQALLNFSHASTDAHQPISLNEIIEEIYTLIAQELKLQNISIQSQFQPNLPLILGDVQLLQQVILGFISNAQWAIQKKSGEEGGTITIKIRYETGVKEVCLSVSDSGIGISKENLEKIFSPFFTTKEVGEGTGLGLSIIYGIIKAHKGTVTVESEFGAGTTFKVILPAISGVE